MVRFSPVRQFRKTLSYQMNASDPVVIGDRYHHRAILIPLTNHVTWAHGEQRKAIARAAKQMLLVLKQLRQENRA